MPLEVKTDRCKTHPGRPAVDSCARCKRPLCLACAVPVRGQVLGPECLTPDLTGGSEQPEPTAWIGWAGAAAIAGAAIAAAATALPWTRFGNGAGPFGAWVTSLRWSVLAAVAIWASLIWMVLTRRTRGMVATSVRLALTVTSITAGVLSIVAPPPFTKAALGPWVFIAGAVMALVGTLAGIGTRRR